MKTFGLLGRNINYSFSPDYFETKFKKQNITDCTYELIDLENLQNIRTEIEKRGMSGFNVTTPYKIDIIAFLDELDESAKAIEAVNCVKIVNGKWIGFNTDGFGFHQMIKPFLEQKHERAFILGKGGASYAVVSVLEKLGVQCFYLRREAEFPNEIEYNQLNEMMMQQIQVLVNCTPLGTFPNVNEKPEIPYEALSDTHFLIDLVYNPPKTQFLKEGEKRGAMILNGYDMLMWQAEKSWEIWNV
ncbi:MAG: shikimate dehydrogenase family protein [Flavobacteriales bacterium]